MTTPTSIEAMTETVDYPLYVVTVVTAQERRGGCIAGFITQCSITPPRYLVCLSELNHIYSVAQEAHSMALHLLGAQQRDLAALFAEQTGDDIDKFSHCEWRPGPYGLPILGHCAAWTAGPIVDRFKVGDHTAFLVDATEGGAGTQVGLLTLRQAPELHPGHPA